MTGTLSVGEGAGALALQSLDKSRDQPRDECVNAVDPPFQDLFESSDRHRRQSKLRTSAHVESPRALAQQSGTGRERGGILLGAFITDQQTDARLDSNQASGDDIDLEDDLGFDSSTSVARFGGYYWFNARHRVDLGYFDLSRDAQARIDEAIDFGDSTFAVDTMVASTWDLAITKADYTFAVLTRDRGFLGLTGGLYIAKTQLALREAALGSAETNDVTAPLPVFGLRGDYAITDKITLRGAAQYFQFKAKETTGRFRDFYVGADYSFTSRLAVGLAYNDVSMNVRTTEHRGLEGHLDWAYDGALLYLKFNFGHGP